VNLVKPITQINSSPSIWGSLPKRTLNVVLLSTKAGLYVSAGVAFDQALYKITSAHENFFLSIHFICCLVNDLSDRKVRSWQQNCLLLAGVLCLVIYKIIHLMIVSHPTHEKQFVVDFERTEWRPQHQYSSDPVTIADCDLSPSQLKQKYPTRASLYDTRDTRPTQPIYLPRRVRRSSSDIFKPE